MNKSITYLDLYIVYIVGLISGRIFFFRVLRILKLFIYINNIIFYILIANIYTKKYIN